MIRTDSVVLTRCVQVITPITLLVALYLFFAGHNQPGGGFAGGLVIGLIVVLRMMAGLQQESFARLLTAVGIIICSAVAILPLTWGATVLDQHNWKYDLPVLGELKFGTALAFDFGITLIVVGLAMAVVIALSPNPQSEELV